MLAATNRAGDPRPGAAAPRALRPPRRRAAARPGRARGRSSRVHTRSIPLAADVDLDALAATTPGMVGADLANLANEAALLAARRDHDAGRDGRLHRLAREDHARRAARDHARRRRTASGPPTTSPATRSSACSRRAPTRSARSRSSRAGMALGVTLSTPDADRVSYSREELHGEDQGRARRPRRRGGRLRHDHHRRRVRHPAADRRSPARWSAAGA